MHRRRCLWQNTEVYVWQNIEFTTERRPTRIGIGPRRAKTDFPQATLTRTYQSLLINVLYILISAHDSVI